MTNVLQVKQVAERYNVEGSMCTEVADYNILMRYLISVIIFCHFQRPSVAAKMTIKEFVRAKAATDGRMIILVADHKTGAQAPAQVALELEDYKVFAL